MRAAIIDDRADDRETLFKELDTVLREKGYRVDSIDLFDSGEQFLNAFEPGKYDLLFFDIYMDGMNGIEAAKELRRLGERLSIVFISSTAEYALEGYQVDALRYLQKPIQYDKLREALLSAYKMKSVKGDTLTFQVGDRLYKIPFGEIEYLESQGRETVVSTINEQISVHMKFSDMEQLLPEDTFIRCHRSYIVNLLEVENIERYQATMKNQDYIPISQQQYTEMKNRMFQCQTRNG
jgi:DNA-binding LytR/AlgR family response regulator